MVIRSNIGPMVIAERDKYNNKKRQGREETEGEREKEEKTRRVTVGPPRSGSPGHLHSSVPSDERRQRCQQP